MYNRTRSRGGFSPATFISAFWTTPSTPVWVTSTLAERSGTLESMYDVVTPGASRRMSAGLIINSPMRRSKEVRAGTGVGFKMRNTTAVPNQTQYWEADGDYLLCALGPPGHLSNVIPTTTLSSLILETSTASLAGVSAPTQELLVSAAEFSKTIKMIASPARALCNLVQTYGRRNKLRNLSDAAAGSWLEYRYGWRPLMKDIQDGLEALEKVYSPRMTSRATRSVTSELTGATSWVSQGGLLTHHGTSVTKADVTCRAYCLYEWLSSLFDSSRAHGVRISDIPSAMWELVPYSFVVDWFVNTTSLINALAPRGDIRRLAEGYVLRTNTESTRIVTSTSYTGSVPGWTFTQQSTGTHTRRSEDVVRVVDPLRVGLVLKSRTIDWSSDLRSLDAFFLLSSAVTNRISRK